MEHERERRHLAAASAHLHLAAAAHYLAEAGDIEMGHGGHGDGLGHGGFVGLAHGGHGDLVHGGGHGELGHGGGHVELGHGGGHVELGHGGGHVELGHGDDGDDADADEEELEWTMQDLYDLLLLLASFVPPAPAYKALPQDVVEGLAWTWFVLVYGVFLAVAVTTFSVRVLGLGTSTRCLPTTLRVLLLTATVVSEVFAAIYMMPATTLTAVGACFTVVLLLSAHLVASRRRL